MTRLNLTSLCVITASFLILFWGCSRRSKLEESLVGRWQSIGMHVTIHTFANTDSTVIMDFDEEDLRTRFKLKPMITVLNDDGTYFLEYRAQNDSLVARPTGEWSVKDDSIRFHQLTPTEYLYSYHVTMMPDKAEFRGMMDYDGDGKSDDEMIALSRKIGAH